MIKLPIDIRKDISHRILKGLAVELMPAAVTDVEFAIRDDFSGLLGPGDVDRAVPVAVKEQQPSAIERKQLIEIHLPQVRDVIPAHVHPAAKQRHIFGNLLRRGIQQEMIKSPYWKGAELTFGYANNTYIWIGDTGNDQWTAECGEKF